MNTSAHPARELWAAVFACKEIPCMFLQACEIFWPVFKICWVHFSTVDCPLRHTVTRKGGKNDIHITLTAPPLRSHLLLYLRGVMLNLSVS